MEEYYRNSLFINRLDGSVREVVRFCRKLTAFQELCDEDQLALVKSGVYESLYWHHLAHLNFDEQSWVFSMVCLTNVFDIIII